MVTNEGTLRELYKLAIYCLALMPFSGFTQTIKVGLIDFPPHISFNEKNEKSLLVQYINNAFTSAGLKVKFTRFPGERGTIELNKGSIDILLPIDDDGSEIKTLSLPVFHSVPGLCFKKENFIPILSATHRFHNLLIGVPIGVNVVSPLADSSALLVSVKGDDAIDRGIELTQRGRLDAFYHPNPNKVYHRKNKLFKEVACSSFHGFSNDVNIAVSPLLAPDKYERINKAFVKSMKENSYEYYFASHK